MNKKWKKNRFKYILRLPGPIWLWREPNNTERTELCFPTSKVVSIWLLCFQNEFTPLIFPGLFSLSTLPKGIEITPKWKIPSSATSAKLPAEREKKKHKSWNQQNKTKKKHRTESKYYRCAVKNLRKCWEKIRSKFQMHRKPQILPRQKAWTTKKKQKNHQKILSEVRWNLWNRAYFTQAYLQLRYDVK